MNIVSDVKSNLWATEILAIELRRETIGKVQGNTHWPVIDHIIVYGDIIAATETAPPSQLRPYVALVSCSVSRTFNPRGKKASEWQREQHSPTSILVQKVWQQTLHLHPKCVSRCNGDKRVTDAWTLGGLHEKPPITSIKRKLTNVPIRREPLRSDTLEIYIIIRNSNALM